MAKTLYDKLWDEHVVRTDGDSALLYIDRHLLHEVTSPQAFEGLKLAGRSVWRAGANLAVPDHNVPTVNRVSGVAGISDKTARLQVITLEQNCAEFGIFNISMTDKRQGIVHVIGPELGAVLPGMTVVCGDSHTSTHGALGALAFGIGTSEVEHVLAAQCLPQKKSKNMQIRVNGKLSDSVSAKDIILYIISKIGTAGGSGFAIEFAGEVIADLSIEGRMTICNMAIEAGARVGMVAVDQKTIDYVKDRPYAPAGKELEAAIEYWQTLHSDVGAKFAKVIEFNAEDIKPQATWGTSPEMCASLQAKVPDPAEETDEVKAHGIQKALTYMGLKASQKIMSIKLDRIFIGSCTNSRIEDLRAAAKVIKGKQIAANIKQALVVPGSGLVKQQAESEGLDQIFTAAGFAWREPGCSMCLAMNADKIESGEHCASTSNRNFEGRQGAGGRTHLVSPQVAAASALAGYLITI